MQLIIVVCMFIQLCGTYFIWPNRWNIPTHMMLSLFFAAFFLPCLFTDTANAFTPDVVIFTVEILVAGSVTYLTGLVAGNFIYSASQRLFQRQRNEGESTLRLTNIIKRSYIWMLVGCACMVIAFAGMGFIPALAKSPLEAKFFRGQYAAPYHRVEIFYRAGLQIISLLVTVEFCSWLDTKKVKHLFIVLIAALLMTLGLVRGPAVTGIMLAIGLYVAKRSRAMVVSYWVSVVFIFCLGSVSFYFLFMLMGSQASEMYDTSSIATMIASGAPDLNDMLTFVQHFNQMPEFTYGRTFIGGLIPNHYPWNPAVWTLHIVNPNTDVNEIASGGLRLPLPLWGYVSFGWVGAFLVPLFSGLLQGGFISYVKRKMAESSSLTATCIILMMYMNVYVIIYQFWSITIYQIPAIFILIFLTSQINFQLSPNVRSISWGR